MKKLYETRKEELAELKRRLETPGIIAVTGEAGSGKTTILKALSEDVDSIAIFPEKPAQDIAIIREILFELEERLAKEHYKPEHYRLFGLQGMKLIGNNFGLSQLHDYFVDLINLYNVQNDKTLTIIIDTDRELQGLETFFTPLPDVNVVYSTEEQVEDGIMLAPIRLDTESVAKTPLEHEIIKVYDEYGLSGEPVGALYDYYLDTYGKLARDLFGYLTITDYGIRLKDLVKILGEIPEELLSSPLLDVTETVQFASLKIAATIIGLTDDMEKYGDSLSQFEPSGRAGVTTKLLIDDDVADYMSKLIERGEGEVLAQAFSILYQSSPTLLLNLNFPKGDDAFYEFLIKVLPEWMPNIDEETFEALQWRMIDWINEREKDDEIVKAYVDMLVEHNLENRDLKSIVELQSKFLRIDSALNNMFLFSSMKMYGLAYQLYLSLLNLPDFLDYDGYEKLQILFRIVELQLFGNFDYDIENRLEEAEALIETLEDREHLETKLDFYRALYCNDGDLKGSLKTLSNVLQVFERDVEKNPTFQNKSDLLRLYSDLAGNYDEIDKKRRALEYYKKTIALSRELLHDYRLYTDFDHCFILTKELLHLHKLFGYELNPTIRTYLDEYVELIKRVESTEMDYYGIKLCFEPLKSLLIGFAGQKIPGMKEVLDKAIEISMSELSKSEDSPLRFNTCFLMIANCLDYTEAEDFINYSETVAAFLGESIDILIESGELIPKTITELIDQIIDFYKVKIDNLLENEVDLDEALIYCAEIGRLMDIIDENSTRIDLKTLSYQLDAYITKVSLANGDFRQAQEIMDSVFKEMPDEVREDLVAFQSGLLERSGVTFDPNRPFDEAHNFEDIRVLYHRTMRKEDQKLVEEDVKTAERVIEMAQNDESLLDSTRAAVIASMYYKIAMYLVSNDKKREAIDTLKKALEINENPQTRYGLLTNGEILHVLKRIDTDEADAHDIDLINTYFEYKDRSFSQVDQTAWEPLVPSVLQDNIKGTSSTVLEQIETQSSDLASGQVGRKKKKKKRKKRKKGRR